MPFNWLSLFYSLFLLLLKCCDVKLKPWLLFGIENNSCCCPLDVIDTGHWKNVNLQRVIVDSPLFVRRLMICWGEFSLCSTLVKFESVSIFVLASSTGSTLSAACWTMHWIVFWIRPLQCISLPNFGLSFFNYQHSKCYELK